MALLLWKLSAFQVSWKPICIGPWNIIYTFYMKKKQTHIFMPPTSKKFRGHISLGLSVYPSVSPSVRYAFKFVGS